MDARCHARQASDQMFCQTCNLVWDVNDPDPPPCKIATDRTNADAIAQHAIETNADAIAQHAIENNAYARAKMRRYG